MNIADLHSKLVAAARVQPPSDHVPYAFEQRILARLASRRVPDGWGWWTGVLWRATAPCLAVAVLLSVWTFASGGFSGAGDSLDSDLEQTVFAAIENPAESW